MQASNNIMQYSAYESNVNLSVSFSEKEFNKAEEYYKKSFVLNPDDGQL